MRANTGQRSSVRPGQVPDAHQDFGHDLPAREAEGLAEQLDPSFRVARLIGGKPAGEAAELAPQALDHLGVGDRGIDLQPVPNDAAVGEQSFAIRLAIGGDVVDIKPVVSLPEGLPCLNTVNQLKPAWLISRIKRSNSTRSLRSTEGDKAGTLDEEEQHP